MRNFLLNLVGFIFVFVVNQAHAVVTLKVGASSTPHAEILEAVKPILAQQGIKLKIVIFQDYIMPNRALVSNDLDANFYQHIAFLNKQNADFNYGLVNLGSIHIEPMGLYSKRFKSLDEVTDGTTVIMSNSITDRPRVLSILEDLKLIKLRTFKNDLERAQADLKDIVSNPKNLIFKVDVQPSFTPRAYFNDSAGLIFINTNYAVSSNINPKKQALFLEDGNRSLYANILVSRQDNANDPNLLKLLFALQSPEIQNYILQKYNGLIVPIKG